MKKTIKNILIIFGIFAVIIIVLLGSVLYVTRYKVTVVDTAESADGAYEIRLQSIGEPAWPFGAASGQLVLKKDGITISKTNIKIANDGAPISKNDWCVTWCDNYVEIILTGEEQYDELVKLYYDGKTESCR